MSQKKCPNCGAEVSSSAPACPECGKDLSPIWLKLGCALVVIGIIGVAIIGRLIASGDFMAGSRKAKTTKIDPKEIARSVEKLKNTPVNENITEKELTEALGVTTDLTEYEQETYLERVKGEKIRWTGKVNGVKKFGDGYIINLKIEIKKMGVHAIVIDDSGYVPNLREDQEVTVVGLIKGKVFLDLGLFPAYLED